MKKRETGGDEPKGGGFDAGAFWAEVAKEESDKANEKVTKAETDKKSKVWIADAGDKIGVRRIRPVKERIDGNFYESLYLDHSRSKMVSTSINDRITVYPLFKEIQIPFMNNCPPNRKNFLSYSYVLHKFCELLEYDHLLEYFSLLKSREKLHQQDLIWEKMCKDLNWEFIPSL